MDNLSGGEKTVAALALLFAIHRWGVCGSLAPGVAACAGWPVCVCVEGVGG